MDRLARILWLGMKELRSLLHDPVMIGLLVFSFTFSVYTRAEGMSSEVHNATIGLVDEDHSTISRLIASAFHRPYFQDPQLITADEIDAGMDSGRFMFVLDIPPRFEAHLLAGRPTAIQLHIDATAMSQASIGASYIGHIVADEAARLLQASTHRSEPVRLVTRMAFNPNREHAWFNAIVTIIDHVTMLTIILTGAALIREREHGTIEHLLAMPLRAFDIAASKVWANGLVILIGVARSMAQFALLVLLVLLPLQMLSGGKTPVESQPDWLRAFTALLPSRHFVTFSQGILFRGAGLEIVWPQLLIITVLGLAFFSLSLVLFRRSIAGGG